MKIRMNLALGIGLILASVQGNSQNVVISRNAFVSIPVFDSYRVTGAVETGASDGLKQMCSDYHKILDLYKGMPEESIKKIFTSRREESGDWQDFLETKFKVGFAVEANSLRDLLKGVDKSLLNNRAAEIREKQSLPLSAQEPMSVEVVDLSSSSISLQAESGSLSALAKSMGLEYSGVKIERIGPQYLVNVYGADLACDLREGKVKLLLGAKALVRPEVSAQDDIGQFYFDLAQKMTSEMKASKSNRKRIVSLGFYAGTLLEKTGVSDVDKQSLLIENLMELLFIDDNLKLSGVWNVNSRQEYMVNVQKMTEALVKLELLVK